MDANVRYVDDVKPMIQNNLYRVRGVEGVLWAVPLYKGTARAKMTSSTGYGRLRHGDRAGDPARPRRLLAGRRPQSISTSAGPPTSGSRTLSSSTRSGSGSSSPARRRSSPGATKNSLVVPRPGARDERPPRRSSSGICETTRTFQSNPVVYTTYSRAKGFVPQERKILSYILAKAEPGRDPGRRRPSGSVTDRPEGQDERGVRVEDDDYYLKYTGIPINFGITTLLGFLVGTAIAGQTFYNFTIENLKQFGALKAMGLTNERVARMILLQATVVGLLGYGWASASPPSSACWSGAPSWPSSPPGNSCRSPPRPSS